jgi:hypothetical protein
MSVSNTAHRTFLQNWKTCTSWENVNQNAELPRWNIKIFPSCSRLTKLILPIKICSKLIENWKVSVQSPYGLNWRIFNKRYTKTHLRASESQKKILLSLALALKGKGQIGETRVWISPPSKISGSAPAKVLYFKPLSRKLSERLLKIGAICLAIARPAFGWLFAFLVRFVGLAVFNAYCWSCTEFKLSTVHGWFVENSAVSVLLLDFDCHFDHVVTKCLYTENWDWYQGITNRPVVYYVTFVVECLCL